MFTSYADAHNTAKILFWLGKINCYESRSQVCEAIGLTCVLVMEIFCVAILCIVGGAAFIAAGNALKDYDPRVLAYGVSAGLFGILLSDFLYHFPFYC